MMMLLAPLCNQFDDMLWRRHSGATTQFNEYKFMKWL